MGHHCREHLGRAVIDLEPAAGCFARLASSVSSRLTVLPTSWHAAGPRFFEPCGRPGPDREVSALRPGCRSSRGGARVGVRLSGTRVSPRAAGGRRRGDETGRSGSVHQWLPKEEAAARAGLDTARSGSLGVPRREAYHADRQCCDCGGCDVRRPTLMLMCVPFPSVSGTVPEVSSSVNEPADVGHPGDNVLGQVRTGPVAPAGQRVLQGGTA